jgi:hypothetical protein
MTLFLFAPTGRYANDDHLTTSTAVQNLSLEKLENTFYTAFKNI